MKPVETHYTKNELKVLLMLYFSKVDIIISRKELDYINSIIDNDIYDAIKIEFNNKNDFQIIQKILKSFDILGYSKIERRGFIDEIKELYKCISTFSVLKQNLVRGLTHLL